MRAENIRLVKVITAKSMLLQISISPQPLSRIELLLESVWHLIVATKVQMGFG